MSWPSARTCHTWWWKGKIVMATVYGKNTFGLFENGDFRSGTNTNFTFGTYSTESIGIGKGSLQMVGLGGNNYNSTNYLEVDTNKTYQMICYARTITRGTQFNALAGGYIGFACYDGYKKHVELIQCGGVGNTYLSRDLNPGDSYAYISSSLGWSTSIYEYFRRLLIFPATHPDYGTPHQLSRIGAGDYNICYNQTITQMPEGDYRLTLQNTSDQAMVFPNIGYATPAGTPVSNGQAGGTYNYALGNPNYPEVWTKYETPPFTGESRNSVYPFRYKTKYIRFFAYPNYNRRTDTIQDHVYAYANIFFGECIGGKDYRGMI